MKNFLKQLLELFLDFFPVVAGVAIIVGFVWFMLGWLIPMSNHDQWRERVNFCTSAGGYHTNETFGGLTVCRSLHDHSVFYVDTVTGARYVPAPGSR